LTMYYYDGLTLTEIGEFLGVTESRVCQIHTKALRQLRSKLADRTDSVRTAAPVMARPAPRRRVITHPRADKAPLQLLAS
jgi:Sigma-70, region 4